MVIVLPRSVWTSWEPDPDDLLPMWRPEGFAVHWPGTSQAHLNTSISSVAAQLEAERRLHVSVRGWTDIAYQAAVDNAGRLWDCRGVRWRSAANGDPQVNASHGAITLLLGEEDEPSPEMIEAVRWFRWHWWLPLYPQAASVVGHQDLHATECPGDRAYALVRSGAFLPPPEAAPHEEVDEMSTRVVRVAKVGYFVVWPGAVDMLAKAIPGPMTDAGDEIKAFAGGQPVLAMSAAQLASFATVVE